MVVGAYVFVQPNSGGIYQYTRSIIQSLQDKKLDTIDYFFYIHREWEHSELYERISGRNWIFIGQPLVKRAIVKVAHKASRAMGISPRVLEKLLAYRASIRQYNPSLMVYPAPCSLAFELDVPYLVAVHDMQHRLQPEFGEVADPRGQRDFVYRRCSENAAGVLVDSVTGGNDLRRFYNVDESKIHVLPYVPADYLLQLEAMDRNVLRCKYRLPQRFLFYPAQFWSHKNHLGILEAIALLRREHDLSIPIVFVGAKKNGYSAVVERTRSLQLKDLVHCLGYVPNEEMAGFYRAAEALIMPTFFGPTNIPPMEAFQLGCPVITSSVRGIPEQVGDAALLVDPRNIREIANAIRLVWGNDQLREDLRRRGRQRVARWTQEDFSGALHTIIHRALKALQRVPA